MVEVHHNKEAVCTADRRTIAFLKDEARRSPLGRSRLCLHRSPDDAVHEMIIAVTRDLAFRPHRHVGKSESFHMIEGEIDLVVFDDRGRPEHAIRMAAPGGEHAFQHRMNEAKWHSFLPRTEMAVLHEITNGPFVRDDIEFADFAPEEPEALRRFLAESFKRAAALRPFSAP
ncbi:MAG: WbuC family cupin fold metalloprotein [Tagaea sp.]|nr:WbuC family cupin fold metalloprotein [Tagaea sp.]